MNSLSNPSAPAADAARNSTPAAADTQKPKRARRWKSGRPRLGNGDRRAVRLCVRVDADEHALLISKAADLNISVARLLIESCLARRLPTPPIPIINREEYSKLGKLAVNLNQLARAANSGVHVAGSDLLSILTTEVRRLQFLIIGAADKENENDCQD